MFLNSSLNVELVYIILKSITQFSMVNARDRESTIWQGKEKEISVDSVTGDATLKLNNIVVRDYGAWSRSQST